MCANSSVTPLSGPIRASDSQERVQLDNARYRTTGGQQDQALSVLLAAAAVCSSVAVGAGVLLAHNNPMLAGVAVIATLGTVAALASTEAALYATITVACFDGFVKCLQPGLLTVILKDVFLGIALLHWMWDGVNRQERQSLTTRVAVPAVMFTLYCAAQMFNTESLSWALALAGLRSWVIWIPVFFITYDSIRTRRQFERFIMFIAVISAATGVYIIVQNTIGFEHLYNLSPNFSYYEHFGRTPPVRALGTYVHPGVAGASMGFAATVCAGVALGARAFSIQQLLLFVASPVCLVAMAATGSRAPAVGTVFAIAVFVLMVRRPQLLAGVFVLILIGVSQSHRYVGETVAARYGEQSLSAAGALERGANPLLSGFQRLAEYPLGTGVASGAGAGRGAALLDAPVVIKRGTAIMIENEFGRVMKELGLPGLLLYLWLFWRVLGIGFAGHRAGNPRNKMLASGLMAGAVGLAVQLMVGSALYLAPAGIYFWAACAAAARIPDYEAEERARLEADGRSPEEAEQWQQLTAPSGAARGV